MKPKFVASLVLASSLTACASLPSSGPTGKQIEKGALQAEAGPTIEIVEVTDATALPPNTDAMRKASLAELPPPPTDMVGPGDVLQIYIYEAGVSLFSGSSSGANTDSSSAAAAIDSGVKSQKLPPSRVNDDGDIFIPYAGKLHVMGHTILEIENMIRNSLRGLSQHPQVLVTVSEPVTNSVILSGEIARPGRLVLQTNRETLSDVIALAGGYRGSAKDLKLRIMRHGDPVDLRLSDLTDNPALDVRAYPGDRVMLIQDPRSFSVLGASGRVDQIPFVRSEITLAEAVAASGGVNPNYGDPAAIFVFRYVSVDQGERQPVIYHLNMSQTKSYFLSQRFTMQNGDVLYFGNAAANQPTKMLQLVSQLFSPIMTAAVAVQTVQNSN
ncbi:polysaccharide biosynthesis/export family protein [Novosphingobium resinovorum]|uniref:polysaccharide biosynthesis/export family protein n=1 Tax=Novosphingobium resinovorum TaxID=158500 RepID=UPI002ECFD6CE|nr:polysaccharide biosynthesis/export family protein [Novosphingobium resinovorum]